MLSVMVLGAGAAFSDQDQIENTEAVDACSALNIIGGYEDGSYHPERNIKRSEVTKMICVALNGGKEPNLSVPVTPTFTDVRDTSDGWAEKYIESCVAQGIVSGVGDNRFSPAGNVTGSQLAKMLLVAIGYDADIENFTGNAWETNVNVVATQKGLYKGLENMDVSAAVTRDQAAQMVWNAMQTGMVTYNYTLVSVNGELVSKVELADKMDPTNPTVKLTLLKDKYDAVTVEGYLTDATYNSANGEYTYTINSGTSASILGAGSDIPVVATVDYTDMMGRQVKAMYTVDDNENVVYGMYSTDDVVSATVGELEIGTGSAATDKKVKLNDVEYKLDANENLTPVYKYVSGSMVTNSGDGAVADGDYLDDISVDMASALTLVDSDKNGKYDYAIILPVTVGQVTYVGSKSINVEATNNDTTNYKFEDEDIYEGVAEDDFVTVIAAANSVYEKDIVRKIDTIEGTVDALRNTTDVQIDGTWYKYAANIAGDPASVGDTVAAVVIGDYYYSIEVLDGKTLSNVVMILDADTINSGLENGKIEAKVMYAKDGSTANVKISKADGDSAPTVVTNAIYDGAIGNYTTDGNVVVGAMYTYKEKDGYVELTRLANNVIGDYQFTENVTTAYVEGNAKNPQVAGVNIADDAVVMVYTSHDGGKASFITGKDLKTWNGSWGTTAQVLTDTVDGVTTAKVVALYGTADAASYTGSTAYGYVVDDTAYVEKDDTGYAQMTIWTGEGSEPTTVLAEDGVNATTVDKSNVSTAPEFLKGAFVKYEKLPNGNIGNVEAISAGSTKAIEGIYTNTDGETTLKLVGVGTDQTITDKTVIIYVDAENTEGVEGGKIQVAQKDEYENLIANVVAYNSTAAYGDDELEVLFVDVNNDISNAVVELAATSAAGDINTALGDSGNVVINGAVTSSVFASNNIEVDNGEKLTINGNVTIGTNGIDVKTGGEVVINGKVTLSAASDSDKLTTAGTGTLTITEIDGSADSDIAPADITKLLKFTDNLKVGALTANAAFEIGENQTLTTGAITASQNFTVKGTLIADSITDASKLTGTGNVNIGDAGLMSVAAYKDYVAVTTTVTTLKGKFDTTSGDNDGSTAAKPWDKTTAVNAEDGNTSIKLLTSITPATGADGQATITATLEDDGDSNVASVAFASSELTGTGTSITTGTIVIKLVVACGASSQTVYVQFDTAAHA